MDALSEHLFRHESARIVAALTRLLGVQSLALAEDVAQDAFCRALEIWKVRGIPENPTAWLFATARNRALDRLRHERTAATLAPELGQFIDSEWAPALDDAFEPGSIRDAELRMMFTCCHPQLAEPARLALILNVSCGFGGAEIAAALFSSRAAIEKRIARGKHALAGAKRLFDLSDSTFAARLDTVRRALYLLFNEGYHGACAQTAVRAPLCHEAMRLTALLLDHPPAATPATHALGALMCLHAARLPARVDRAGDLSALVDQDRSRWDQRLVAEGLTLFERSASGLELTPYHLEAAIAATHAGARSLDDTDWATIVGLYDRLLALAPSPVVALSRAIAVGRRDGPERGLHALKTIEQSETLSSYPFSAAAFGELELELGRPNAARKHFRAALRLARNGEERRHLEKRLRACGDA